MIPNVVVVEVIIHKKLEDKRVELGWVLLHIHLYRLSKVKSSLYICIKDMIFKYILLITFLNEPRLIFFCLDTVKWFQAFLSPTNNSTINHLFALI